MKKLPVTRLNALFFILFSVFYSMVSIFLTGCSQKSPQKKTSKIPVRAIEVKRTNLKEFLFYVGDIKAKDEAIVYPKVSGKIIEKIAEEGSLIKKGGIIAYIDRDEVGFQFQKAPVESPIDGIIGSVYVDVGTNVSTQTPIGSVINMDEVRVRVNVVERDLPKIKQGQLAKIEVDAYPDNVFKGTVKKVSPIVDLASRTALVEIKILNYDHKLKPGMFARVKILISVRKSALIVPRDAIIKKDSSNYVFVVKNNSVRKQKIEIGLRENNKFEAVKGLNEGELVVTMGNARLKEGDLVEVIVDKNLVDKMIK